MKNKRFVAMLTVLCLSLSMLLIGCGQKGNDLSTTDTTTAVTTDGDAAVTTVPSDNTNITTAPSDTPAVTDGGKTTVTTKGPTTKNNVTTAPVKTAPPKTDNNKNTTYRNLCKGFVDGVNTSDMWKAYDWDKENRYVTASHSLECAWNPGYGKAYLFDGVKCSKEVIFDHGAWVSCTVKPGWGANSGELDSSTVSWKKTGISEWIIIDLQKNCAINKVNFSTLYSTSSHGMPSDFTIEVSTDKKNFTTVHKETGYEMDITTMDQSFSFKECTARYVRLNFTKASQKIDPNLAYCIALTEVEIWGKDA